VRRRDRYRESGGHMKTKKGVIERNRESGERTYIEREDTIYGEKESEREC
jgi:hypothetical protein